MGLAKLTVVPPPAPKPDEEEIKPASPGLTYREWSIKTLFPSVRDRIFQKPLPGTLADQGTNYLMRRRLALDAQEQARVARYQEKQCRKLQKEKSRLRKP